jgi:hypothetical protein
MPLDNSRSKNPAVPAYPPLPVVQELYFFSGGLFGHAVDDICEDFAKIGLVYASFWMGKWISCGRTSGGIFASLAMYRNIDAAADWIGDTSEVAHRWIMLKVFGVNIATSPKMPKREPRSIVGRLADDLVEDTFKGVCMLAHWRVGGLLAGAVDVVDVPASVRHRLRSLSSDGKFMSASATLGNWLSRVERGMRAGTRWIIALGHTFGSYSDCNAYGDHLGDVAQATAERWFDLALQLWLGGTT